MHIYHHAAESIGYVLRSSCVQKPGVDREAKAMSRSFDVTTVAIGEMLKGDVIVLGVLLQVLLEGNLRQIILQQIAPRNQRQPKLAPLAWYD